MHDDTSLSALRTLDWLQYRAAAPAEARPGMDRGSIRAIVKHVLVAGSLIWLAIASWRAGRAGHRTRHPQPPLIREAESRG